MMSQLKNPSPAAVDPNGKVPLKNKIAYAMGDFGNNFSWTFVSTFLMFFYTDVFGIAAGAVATLVLVARIWDALNDPIVGSLADRTRSRWGRYRPWPMFAAPFCAVLVILTYWAHPDWGNTSKLIYMYVTYGLLVLAYTCVNLPYGTMCSVMTQNTEERAKISTLRMTFALTAIQLISAFTAPLAGKLGGGNNQKGYLLTAVVYAGIFMVCHIICFKNTREVVVLPEQKKISLKVQFKAVAKNTPYLLAVVAQTIWGLNVYGRAASYMYYFKYVEGSVLLLSTYSLLCIVPKILGAFTFQFWYKHVGNKGRVAALAAFVTGVCLFSLGFFRLSISPLPFILILIVEEYFAGVFSAGVYALVPDTAEYGEWKTGVRNDGFQYAFVSLGNKVGMAIGTAGIAAVLGILGYTANVAQSPQVIAAISAFFTTIPAVFWIITAIALMFYKIDRKSFATMVADITARNQSSEISEPEA